MLRQNTQHFCSVSSCNDSTAPSCLLVPSVIRIPKVATPFNLCQMPPSRVPAQCCRALQHQYGWCINIYLHKEYFKNTWFLWSWTEQTLQSFYLQSISCTVWQSEARASHTSANGGNPQWNPDIVEISSKTLSDFNRSRNIWTDSGQPV